MTGLIMMTQKRYRQKVQYCSTLHHSQDCNAEESGTGIFPPKKLFPHETKTWRWPESIGPTSGILHQIIPRLPPGRCRLRSPGSTASLLRCPGRKNRPVSNKVIVLVHPSNFIKSLLVNSTSSHQLFLRTTG